MLANCAKMHFKRMVARVLRKVGKGGAKSTRDTSLGCPELGRGIVFQEEVREDEASEVCCGAVLPIAEA